MKTEQKTGSPLDIPFLDEIGARLVEAGGGRSTIALTLAERHMNSWNSAHGGVVMSLLDAAMSQAGRSLHEGARAGVTVEMKTTFIRPCGAAGMTVEARGFAYHQSTTLCFCEAELLCDGDVAAKASGTFKFMRNPQAVSRLAGKRAEKEHEE